MKRVKARKDEVVARSNQGVTNWLKGTDNLTVYEGHGRFEGPQTVRVNGETLEAEKIFINVGARAFVPDMPGLKDVSYLTNSSMMEVEYLPEHLIIIGGSYIGLEFAQMYRRFGSRVTVIEKGDRLIARDDEDVSTAVKEILENEGIEVRLNAECISVAKRGQGVAAQVDCDSGAPEVQGSHLLLAVGRQPNTHDLGVERAGIEIDERGYIKVDDQLRTNMPHVWATGDVNGRGAFTHTSYNDYEIVVANLFDNDRRVRASGRRALIGKMTMARVGRAYERSETQGFMKIVVDAETKKILGAALLGIEADEVIHSILDVMYADAPYTLIQRAMHIHPTVSEMIPSLLGDLRPLA
jgi:pyruvate/2-oxoglutarate dehydrogenase complex dihydrolipoamide dehydrogenase (E3) component